MVAKGYTSGLALSVLVLVSLTDWVWKEPLWSLSLQLQSFMQHEWPRAYFPFYLIASGSLPITLIPQCLFFYFDKPQTGVHLSLLTFLASGSSGLLKMFYSDPRPYWISDTVEGLTCEQDWGTPSGHALFTSAVWGAVAVALSRKGYKLSIPLVFIWLLLIGLSRLYLGAHFLSQVILGWAWGGVLTALYAVTTKGSGIIGKKGYAIWLGIVIVLGIGAFASSYKDYIWDPAWSFHISHSCPPVLISPQLKALLETSHLAWLPGLLLVAYPSQSSTSYLSTPSSLRKCLLCVLSVLPVVIAAGAGKHYIVQHMRKTWVTVEGWVVGMAIVAGSGLCFGVLPRLASKTGSLLESTK